MTIALWSGTIPADAADIVAGRIERIAKRAQRVGFPVPRTAFGARSIVVQDDGITTVEWIELDILADAALKLGDYEFVGVVSTLEDGSPFITYAPGVERTNFVVTHPKACDHCESNRNRTDTYLVRKGDEVRQVGSSCIKDFTGHDPALITAWLNAEQGWSFTDDEIASWGRSAIRFYPPNVIIELASRIVAKAGYVSKVKAMDEDKVATAELVRTWLTARGQEAKRFEEDFPSDPESDNLYLNTMEAIEAKIDEPVSSDWLADIIRLVSTNGVQWRHVGILGSAVVLGMRKQERVATEGRGESEFIGSKGERITLTNVTVTMKRGYENAYGQGYVIRMSHGDNDLLWFGSGMSADAVEEGDVITLTATVKNHEVDKRSERNTTVVNRPVITKEN